MISVLSGPVLEVGVTTAVLDCHGVGYAVLCPGRTLAALEVGVAARLYTVLNVREDALTLYGFATVAERAFFDQLTSVSGVGPKLGLSLLTTFTVGEIQQAISLNQPSVLARASGVGKKMAEKIIVELKDKLGTLGPLAGGMLPTAGVGRVVNDVVSALVNLGYQPKTAENAAVEALKTLPDAGFEVLFRTALKKVA